MSKTSMKIYMKNKIKKPNLINFSLSYFTNQLKKEKKILIFLEGKCLLINISIIIIIIIIILTAESLDGFLWVSFFFLLKFLSSKN